VFVYITNQSPEGWKGMPENGEIARAGQGYSN